MRVRIVRLQQFALALHPDKTRLIEFGRYAADRRARRGERRPETFDFLGFTHSSGKARSGNFLLIRQTSCRRVPKFQLVGMISSTFTARRTHWFIELLSDPGNACCAGERLPPAALVW